MRDNDHAVRRCETLLAAIGHTPLVRLRRFAGQVPCPIYGKVEFFNPGGSVKDRIGQAMIDQAEAEGRIKPGVSTIIEATAGNTGVGLAMVAAIRGYRCIFVMPDKMSREKISLLRAYGAEVVVVPTNVSPDSPDSYTSVANRLANEIPHAWRPDQFANMANPQVHYLTTGPEIWEQTEGTVTCLVAGVGTGGTISGVGRYLKERNPRVRIVGADPAGSILSGGTPGSWKVEGIGEDCVPKTFNAQVVDEWVRVTDAESFGAARRLARTEGLLVGGSAGTATAAALRYAERLTRDDVVVIMMPDTGRNYLSKFYDDDWLRENGFGKGEERRATAEDILAMKPKARLLWLTPQHTVDDAAALLREHGVSQIPILENGRPVGGIQDVTLARLLHDDAEQRRRPLKEVMARPLPEVDAETSLDEVYRLLMSGNSGALVRRGGEIAGIITRIDLVEYWDRP
ncbi:MAG TPA: cystathionine beta-synthase [Phycisphaerae bacterium]|nr:cystathionine beta-synthase [Phycisphaerae bacterium]